MQPTLKQINLVLLMPLVVEHKTVVMHITDFVPTGSESLDC